MNASHARYLYEPVEPLPVARQLRAANLKGFPTMIRQAGGEPRDILGRHGIDLRQLDDPDNFLDGQSYVDTLEYCGTTLNQPHFGLRLAEHQGPDVFGCVTALCRAADAFGDAVEYLINYIPVVHAPEGVMELCEGEKVAELRWFPSTERTANDQASYHGLMSVLEVLRMVGGSAFSPTYVTVTAAPGMRDAAGVEKLLRCPVRSRAGMNSIAFPQHCLDQPVVTSNRLLVSLLGGYLERARKTSRKSIIERVEDYVRGALPIGRCSIERCADKLHIPARSLQLRLSQNGVSYSELVERLRQEAASRYLRQTDLTHGEIAGLLGYSEQTSFNRAFRRWFGITPQVHRAGRASESNRHRLPES